MKYPPILIILLLFFLFPSSSFAQTRTTRLQVPLGKATVQIEKKGDNTSAKILVHDYLSSTKAIISQTGALVKVPEFYPYGTSINSISVFETNKQYTGQSKVADESSVYNYNARYYNPATGVFIQPDSVEGPARFTYVAGNPIMNSDPSGHQCRTEISSGCLDPGAILLGESVWEEAYKMSDEEKEIAGNGILSASMGMASLLRFHPIGGAAIGGIELYTGKRWGSEDGLSGGDKFFATAGVVLPFADRGLGIVNKTVQSARVARYEHGAELLRATSIDEVQSLALKANPKITFSRYVDRNTLASYNRGGSDPLIGKEFAIGNRGGVEILKHEVVHALQDVNGFFKGLAPRPRGRDYWEAISSNRSFFSDSGRLKSTVRIFDSEVMAYATTENHRTLSAQLLHSLSSTKSYAPSLSKTAIQAERFVDRAQLFGGHAIRGIGAAMSMGAD